MNAYRAALLRQEATQMQAMATRWQAAERNLAQSITDVLTEIAQRQAAGEVFGRFTGPYVRLERYQALLRQVRIELRKYGAYTEDLVQQGIANHVALGVEHSTAAIETLAGGDGGVLAQFNRLSLPASENMAAALQADAPVGQLLADAWPDASVRMTEALMNGVALGWNPRKTARAMREGLQAGALQRCLTIARTEQLRAYRTASLENYRQSNVVTAYKRLASKSVRTCIACLIADGRVYALEESFDEHPNGRCTLVPILVGRDAPTWETGRTWFDRQPAATQRQLLGPASYAAWQAGAIRLEDLVERHEHPVWGGSLGQRSLRSLLGEDAKKYGRYPITPRKANTAPEVTPSQLPSPVQPQQPTTPQWQPAATKEDLQKRMAVHVDKFELDDLPLAKQNRILKAVEEVLGRDGQRINRLGYQTGNERSLGHAVLRGNGDVEIEIQKTFLSNPEEKKKETAERFDKQRKQKIQSFEDAVADPRRTQLLDYNRKQLQWWQDARRWAMYESATDPLDAAVRHELYHALDYRYLQSHNGIRLSDLLAKELPERWSRVSAYGASKSSEMWTEIGTAIDLGIEIPAEFIEAFRKVKP